MKTNFIMAFAFVAGTAIAVNTVSAQSADNATTSQKKEPVQKTKTLTQKQKQEAKPVIQSQKTATKKTVITKPSSAPRPKTSAAGPGLQSKSTQTLKTRPVNQKAAKARTTNKTVNDVKSLDKTNNTTAEPAAKVPSTVPKKSIVVKPGTKMTPAKAEAVKKATADPANKTE
jgi:hypothetical protein